MKFIVGLGNPGKKYAGTRHNVGFDVLEILRRRWQAGTGRTQFQAEVVEVAAPAFRGAGSAAAAVAAEKVLLIWPQTFMNLSGSSVLAARDFYKVSPTDILVICDDFAIPLGRLRIRPFGSAGGQNGLADVLKRLGTNNIPRLRIGVGPLPPGWNAAEFVLGRFTATEQTEIDIQLQRAADAAALWAGTGDLSAAMNQYNTAGN
ncbi:MAG: aminoacyl-tRNA hydrolase [Pirellulales bacterium]|nr:aminoacyl-tRNA hydrolase [Pirellulales bacterium]